MLKIILLTSNGYKAGRLTFNLCPKVNTETVKFKAKGQGIDVAIEKVRSKDIS